MLQEMVRSKGTASQDVAARMSRGHVLLHFPNALWTLSQPRS